MQPLPKISPPFLQRLKMKNGEAKFKKFVSLFNYLSINHSLFEKLLEMLGYSMFMEDLFTKEIEF